MKKLPPDYNRVFTINNNKDFEEIALEVFYFQYNCNPVYRQYVDLLEIDVLSVTKTLEIPFLPIRFFKSKNVYAGEKSPQLTFTSSGTTGLTTSRHPVADTAIYERSFLEGFHTFYGQPSDFAILALLPAYLEREGSSLIYMVDCLIKESKYPESGFFLHNHDELFGKLNLLQQKRVKTLLIGVSFALLDFVEKYHVDFPELIVMETGGMKGRRKEIPREELHNTLKTGFGVESIHSEYGMTELLSQAYSQGAGHFYTPPWMRVFIRDAQNPLSLLTNGKSGGINIIDLANIFSCSFIETEDLGKTYPDNSFTVQGRLDESDLRGCNLLLIE